MYKCFTNGKVATVVNGEIFKLKTNDIELKTWSFGDNYCPEAVFDTLHLFTETLEYR